MAYQRPNQGGGQKTNGGPSAPAQAPKSTGRTPSRGGGATRAASGAKNKPNYDIVALNEEGEIVKELVKFDDGGEKMLSKQLGAIWFNEGDDSMFIKLEDGTTAKAFKRKTA